MELDYREPEWVADRLALDKNTIYKFLQDGTIPAIQLGRKWLISEARLVEWLRQETDRQTRTRREGAAKRPAQRLHDLTPAARLAIKHAHTEARRLGHEHLGPEHLLLGLAMERTSPSARALSMLAMDPGQIRSAIEHSVPRCAQPVARRLGRSVDAKRAMRIASRLASRDMANRVSAEHLLMGILLGRRGLGHEILRRQGVTRRRLQAALSAVGCQSSSRGDEHGL